MEMPFQNGAVVYEEGRMHKFGVNVMSWQVNKYNMFEAPSYPLELLSSDEMVAFEAECKREGYDDNNLPGTNQPVPTGVARSRIFCIFWLVSLCLILSIWSKGSACVSGSNLGEQCTNLPCEGTIHTILLYTLLYYTIHLNHYLHLWSFNCSYSTQEGPKKQ